MTLATGSLGQPGDPTHAGSFYSGIKIAAVDYSRAHQLADPLAAPVPFQPSYEDRPAGPDRVFAAPALSWQLSGGWLVPGDEVVIPRRRRCALRPGDRVGCGLLPAGVVFGLAFAVVDVPHVVFLVDQDR
jgi:hypothetical protein